MIIAAAFFVASGQADTYLEWKQRVFSETEQADPAISGELAPSPAGDGIPNLLKYAFGLDPHQSGSLGVPQIGTQERIDPGTGEATSHLTITYRISTADPPSDLYFVPEISPDLQTWVRGDLVFDGPAVQDPANSGDPAFVTYQTRSPINGAFKTFLRVRVLRGHGLPEDWQVANFGYTGVDPDGDEDLDGLTNFDEFLHGTDPNEYYNGRTPVLQILSGDGQRNFPSQPLPFPLVVRLTYNSAPLVNAPVRFSVSAGSAQVAAANATPQISVDVRTDTDGLATVFAYLSTTPNETSLVQASSGGQSATFSETSLGPPAAKVAAGDYHSLALDVDGIAWTWGDNSYGQLGDGTWDLRNRPADNRFLPSIADIAGGSSHSVFVARDGSVWACGANWAGQLGDGTTDDHTGPVMVAGLTGAIATSAGAYHTIALRADGTVWGWGYNYEGELGDGTSNDAHSPVQVVIESGAPLRDVVAIAAGYYHNLALKTDGTVWAWGANYWGMVGDDSYLDRHYAVQVAGLSNVTTIKCGGYHSLVTQHTNGGGGIGFQSAAGWTRRGEPMRKKSPSDHWQDADATTTAPQDVVWVWGQNFFNQLGDGTYVNSGAPIPITLPSDVINVAGGNSHTLAITSAGTVWGWGSNGSGEAVGDPNIYVDGPTEVPGLASITAIAAGNSFSLGLASNGLIYGWGDNRSGQLGTGDTSEVLAPVSTAKDSNRSGMPDAWQLEHFGRAGVDPNGDDDGDGLTNAQEYTIGTDPMTGDTDGDGFADGLDGWPLDKDLHPPRLPEYHYAVIDLGPGKAVAINNKNEIVGDADGRAFTWKKGVRQELRMRGDADYAIGINDDGAALLYCANALPAVWMVDHYVDVGVNADSQKRVFGWDPNIVWQYADTIFLTGINNSGQVSGWCWATWSGEHQYPNQKTWPLFWSASYAEPDLLFATLDSNDHELTVNDNQYWGFLSNYNDDTSNDDFHGHFDNRRGLDNSGAVVAINNAGQVVGTIEHGQDYNGGGFPVRHIYDSPLPDQSFNEVTLWTNGQPESVAKGHESYKYAQSLNDDGVIVGGDALYEPPSNGEPAHYFPRTILWVKVEGEWKEKDLGPATGEEVRRINRKLQIIAGKVLFQNGHAIDLYTRIPSGYENLNLLGINEAGFMVGQADTPNGAKHAVLLVPAELLVDANRDGKMSFSDVATHDADLTDQATPYRFWVNDDDDTETSYNSEVGEPFPLEGDTLPAQRPDHSIHQIYSKRNLEDFSRLWIYFGALSESIKSGEIKVGLRWREVVQGMTPAVNIYPSADEEGSDSYLKDDQAAQAQINGVYNDAVRDIGNVQTITANTLFIFKDDYWNGLDADHPSKCLLFEGAGEGGGQLELVFFDHNFNEIGSGGGVWLDLKNVKKMYQRVEGAYDHPWEHVRFEPGPAEDASNLIVFVHGWRMSPESAGNYAETMFKRLWHRGYKGRFAAYHWDTWWFDAAGWIPFTGEAIDAYLSHYNDSEYIAWHSAPLLRSYVTNAPFHNKNVVAHSMGNIVAGEALREGMIVNNYALLQAAVPAACYDEDEERIRQTSTYYQLGFGLWDSAAPDGDNDPFTRSLAYRGTFEGVGSNANLVNFYLPADHATSFAWEVNNDQTKPPLYQDGFESASLDFNFEYEPNGGAGQKLWKFEGVLQHRTYFLKYKPEAMAYACRTWGKAVGAWESTQGAIRAANRVDLSDPTIGGGSKGFDTEHNAEFNFQIQQLESFWDRLLSSFQISPNE